MVVSSLKHRLACLHYYLEMREVTNLGFLSFTHLFYSSAGMSAVVRLIAGTRIVKSLLIKIKN